MANQTDLNRRVDVSADISDYVYDYEAQYYKTLQEGGTETEAKDAAIAKIADKLANDGLSLADSSFNQDTGIAAIAVEDSKTGETYIAYAGTNPKADFWKDAYSDANIALNDPLYLKQIGDSAIDFYDKVQKKGYNITVVTGHSFGDFSSSRVAMERDVPYMFGYQGAPQYVSGLTAQELLVQQIYDNGGKPSQDLLDAAKASREEVNRIKRLMSQYSGYAATFSTTGDMLTNALWEQSDGEVDFGADMLHTGANLGIFGLSGIMGTYPDTQYLGKVVAVDTGTAHDMAAYRNNQDAMLYTKQIVLTQILSADIDGDGVTDFALTQEYLTRQSLIPKFAQSGDGKTIKLDADAMTVLKLNLINVSEQLNDFAEQTALAIRENNEVIANLSTRRQKLKDAIMNELENVSLVQAVKDIDTAFTSLDELRTDLSTLSGYSSYEFKRKFDGFGSSGNYDWYKNAKATKQWDYGGVASKLDDMVSAASSLIVKMTLFQLATNPSTSATFYNQTSYTDVANEGAELINSYETIVEETTKGLGNRSKFEDGIPEAVGEILEVISDNLATLIQCTQYMIDVCEKISGVLTSTDEKLATDIQNLDLSGVSVPDVSIASSYTSFLKTSQVFDDQSVLKSFDDAVDTYSTDLASQMSTSFTNYLSSVQSEIEAINTPITDVLDALYSVTSHFDDSIYYRYKKSLYEYETIDSKTKEMFEKVNYYGRVKEQISIADTIDRIYSDTEGASSIRRTDREMTLAITTINTVYSTLGNFKDPFRLAMEDAFYGAAGLAGIVKVEKLIGEALIAIEARFSEFQSMLSSYSGAAVSALIDKVDETTTTMNYVSTMITDCFGD